MTLGRASLVVFTFFLASIWAPRGALAEPGCGVTGPVQELVDALGIIAMTEGPVAPHHAVQIGEAANRISTSAVVHRLDDLGLAHKVNAVETLMEKAEDITKLQYVTEPWYLRVRLQGVQRLISLACRIDPTPVSEIDTAWAISQGLEDLFGAHDAVDPNSEKGLALRVAKPFVFLMALLLTVFGVRWMYLRAYALLHSRKTCRVAAVIRVGEEEVEGHITILGRNGCRFQPVDEESYRRIVRNAQIGNAMVKVAGRELPLRIYGLHQSFVSSFFKTPISFAMHKRILEQSDTEPVFVKQSGPKQLVASG